MTGQGQTVVLVSRLRYVWHRIRGHRAYWHGWGSACNTCDVDFR